MPGAPEPRGPGVEGSWFLKADKVLWPEEGGMDAEQENASSEGGHWTWSLMCGHTQLSDYKYSYEDSTYA